MSRKIKITKGSPIPPWPSDVKSLRELKNKGFTLLKSSREQFALGEHRIRFPEPIVDIWQCPHCESEFSVENGYSPKNSFTGPCPVCKFPDVPVNMLMDLLRQKVVVAS